MREDEQGNIRVEKPLKGGKNKTKLLWGEKKAQIWKITNQHINTAAQCAQ